MSDHKYTGKQDCSGKFWRGFRTHTPEQSQFLLISFVCLSKEASELYFQANNYKKPDDFSEITHEIFFSLKSITQREEITILKITASMCVLLIQSNQES